MNPWVVGLTGGIGSGKSLVADLFHALGVAVVDTDLIAHELTAPGGPAIALIREAFGDTVVAAEGGLDRAAMRALVFADPSQRQRLEAILHPMIRARSAELLAAVDAQVPYALLAVPLLFETSAYRQRVQSTLLIDCPTELQIERVQQRSALARGEVERIVAAQLPRAVRLQLADEVVENNGEIEALRTRIAALHNIFLEKSRAVRQ